MCVIFCILYIIVIFWILKAELTTWVSESHFQFVHNKYDQFKPVWLLIWSFVINGVIALKFPFFVIAVYFILKLVMFDFVGVLIGLLKILSK